jgi:DNA-binding GntR family transcriptional regulator
MRSKERLSEQVYQITKQRLLDGEFDLGERLSVNKLVAELGASRQPVMDGLKRLENEGLLEIIPQVGVQVAALEPREIVDFFRLYTVVEGLCVRLAAERADAAGAARLAKINAEIGQLLSQDSNVQIKSYRQLNRAFHTQIHTLAQSAQLTTMAHSLRDRSDFFINTALATNLFTHRLADAHQEHELICQAIAANDAATAQRLMDKHIMGFISNFRDC